ncbi:hypothetical protein LJR269_006513 [Duganella sp. LjRoot269]
MLQLKEAPAGRRAGGAGGPAAGDGRGQRRAARAGGDRGSGHTVPIIPFFTVTMCEFSPWKICYL